MRSETSSGMPWAIDHRMKGCVACGTREKVLVGHSDLRLKTGLILVAILFWGACSLQSTEIKSIGLHIHIFWSAAKIYKHSSVHVMQDDRADQWSIEPPAILDEDRVKPTFIILVLTPW